MKRILTGALLACLAVAAPLAAEDEEAGKSLYDKRCAICHGKDGVAKKMAEGSANLNDPEWQKATSLETIIEVIAKGKGKMPAGEGTLSEDEIEAIARYVKTLK